MNCEEGNKIDLVEYLFSLGYAPTKIRGNSYWYLSPLRNEKEASFKIDRNKNVWYDHGAGKGGSVVDFVMQYFNCHVQRVLQKLSSYQELPQKRFIPTERSLSIIPSEANQQELFDNCKNKRATEKNHQKRPPFHLHKNSLIDHRDAAETAIEIIAAKKLLTDPILCPLFKTAKDR